MADKEMTALEYMEKQISKHRANWIWAIERNAPEKDIENLWKKVCYYGEAIEALKKAR